MLNDKKYIILRRNTKTGEISAYSQHYESFSSERVTLFCPNKSYCQEEFDDYLANKKWIKPAISGDGIGLQANSPNQREWLKIRRRVLWLNTIKPDGKEFEYKAFRAFSKNCPIEIDYRERKKIILNMKRGIQNNKGSNFEYYNLPFKVIPDKW